MRVKEYANFAHFESDNDWRDAEQVSIVNNPERGSVCADLITECKHWQTALRRFFKALASDPRFDGLEDVIAKSCQNGCWSEKETYDGKYDGGWFWAVEDYDGSYYVCLNVAC